MRAVPVAICCLALLIPGIALAAPGGGPSATAARHCKPHSLHNRLGAALATVLSVRRTSCGHATKVVRRYGKHVKGGFAVGDRFRLGSWRCRTYHVLEEDLRARCTSNHRAFRVGYGS